MKKMKIINLTPHKIRLYNSNFTLIKVIESKEVKKFPSPKKDTFYVVSQITADVLKRQGRIDDILIVDKTVRSDNGTLNFTTGQIVGCMGFAKI